MVKATDIRVETLEADQQRLAEDIQKSKEESIDLMQQLLQNMYQFQLSVCDRLKSLEKKKVTLHSLQHHSVIIRQNDNLRYNLPLFLKIQLMASLSESTMLFQ